MSPFCCSQSQLQAGIPFSGSAPRNGSGPGPTSAAIPHLIGCFGCKTSSLDLCGRAQRFSDSPRIFRFLSLRSALAGFPPFCRRCASRSPRAITARARSVVFRICRASTTSDYRCCHRLRSRRLQPPSLQPSQQLARPPTEGRVVARLGDAAGRGRGICGESLHFSNCFITSVTFGYAPLQAKRPNMCRDVEEETVSTSLPRSELHLYLCVCDLIHKLPRFSTSRSHLEGFRESNQRFLRAQPRPIDECSVGQ